MATTLDKVAHQAVLLQLADAHDHFSTLAQLAFNDKRDVEMVGANQHAAWTLRAYRAELDNRPPAEPAVCGVCVVNECDGCPMCRLLERPT